MTKIQFKVTEVTPATLYMNDINEVRKIVRRITTSTAEETLGVWIAPDGNTQVQCNKLVEKAIQWANHMRTGVIRTDETWLALQTTIWRTFSYPLNAMNMTPAQCEAIMSPVLQYALPAMDICRNFPRALVFSPMKHAGIGIKHLHTIQEIARLKDIILHTYKKTITGELYSTSMEYLLLELGMGTDLHLIDYKQYHGLVTNCLLKSTWEFISTHNITLTHNIEVPKNTTMDLPIVTIFAQLKPTFHEQLELNQCRLYLKAYYISDLATASGHSLSYHAWEGSTRSHGSTNRFSWPNQGVPSKASWAIWRKFLKATILSRGMKLKMDLGCWLRQDKDIWPRFFSPAHDGLIEFSTEGKVFLYSRQNPIRSQHAFVSTGVLIHTVPKTLLKASIRKTRKDILWLIDTGSIGPTYQAQTFDNFTEFIRGKTHKNRWCFQDITLPDDYGPLLQDIKNGTVWVVSDGSYHPTTRCGTAAWILANHQNYR